MLKNIYPNIDYNERDLRSKYLLLHSKFSDDGIVDIDRRLKYKFDFWLHELEDFADGFMQINTPSRESNYIVGFLSKSSGTGNIGEFTFPLKDNTLLVVPSRMIHSDIFDSMHCSGYVLHFNTNFFSRSSLRIESVVNRKVFRTTVRPYVYLEPDEANSVVKLFQQMLNEEKKNDRDTYEMLAVKILELLILCDRVFSQDATSARIITYHPVVQNFRDLLDANYKYCRNVQFYAKSLNVHPNHLNSLLKKHNGLNVKQYINNKIISEAKYLLSNSTFIVKEIANQMGFDDANNFSTFFQKATGFSPVSYRESCPMFRSIATG